MHPVDRYFFIAYMLLMLAIGWYFFIAVTKVA